MSEREQELRVKDSRGSGKSKSTKGTQSEIMILEKFNHANGLISCTGDQSMKGCFALLVTHPENPLKVFSSKLTPKGPTHSFTELGRLTILQYYYILGLCSNILFKFLIKPLLDAFKVCYENTSNKGYYQ